MVATFFHYIQFLIKYTEYPRWPNIFTIKCYGKMSSKESPSNLTAFDNAFALFFFYFLRDQYYFHFCLYVATN